MGFVTMYLSAILSMRQNDNFFVFSTFLPCDDPQNNNNSIKR